MPSLTQRFYNYNLKDINILQIESSNYKTEYWKSQERKYCDFCKCWITDNKPSIQFHENGKRHKENVAKKISELTKQSTKAHKQSQKMEEEMKKMEEAALAAYMKDMVANPDFTSQQYKKNQEEKLAVSEDIKEIVKKVAEKAKEAPPPPKPKPVKKKKLWYEAKNEQGYSYYWNIETQASLWEPPEEGYISITEQEKQAAEAAKLQEAKAKETSEEMRAFIAREKMKKYRKEEPKPIKEPEIASTMGLMGPAPKANPYGSWTAVPRQEPTQIDWQLPLVPRVEIPQVNPSEPRIQIKEKKMTSLDDHDCNAPPVFKKRKPNPGRGNMRQRIEDE